MLIFGTGAVEIPAARADTFTIDAMGLNGSTDNDMSRIDFNDAAGTPTIWSGANGQMTGGTATLNVVPEPATLCLLGLGGLAALRRKKA